MKQILQRVLYLILGVALYAAVDATILGGDPVDENIVWRSSDDILLIERQSLKITQQQTALIKIRQVILDVEEELNRIKRICEGKSSQNPKPELTPKYIAPQRIPKARYYDI